MVLVEGSSHAPRKGIHSKHNCGNCAATHPNSFQSRWNLERSPCTTIVYTWALKGFLHPYFGASVCTTMVPGPFGEGTYCVNRDPHGSASSRPCPFKGALDLLSKGSPSFQKHPYKNGTCYVNRGLQGIGSSRPCPARRVAQGLSRAAHAQPAGDLSLHQGPTSQSCDVVNP